METKQPQKRLSFLLACGLTVSLLALAAIAIFQGTSPLSRTGSTGGPRLAAGTVKPHQQTLTAYNRLPLAFEANRGQTDPEVKYLARGNGYTLFLTSQDAVLSLANRAKSKPNGADSSAKIASSIVHMQVVGAQARPEIAGEQVLPGTSNYFVGRNRDQWRTGVPHYAQVRYGKVYPGIDLAYHGGQGQLEFDFVVAPGADPAQIALQFSGARGAHTDDAGNLVLASAAQDVVLHQPVAYQEREGQRHPVEARFVVSDDKITFALGAYDRSRELVIDPTVSYATYLGGSGEDDANGIAVDSTGTYVTGETASANFPSATGSFHTGTFDVFVAKLNPAGTSLLYSTYIGGNNDDSGNAIAVDGSQNVYVTGGTNSSDFPTTAGAFQTIFMGSNDAFVLKLNSAGSILTYSTLLGGTLSDTPDGIAVDSSGNAIVGGVTLSSDFPLQSAKQTAAGNGFVTKVNTTGTALVFSTYLGGAADAVTAVGVDASGNVYATGSTFSTTFPVTTGAYDTQCGTDGLCNSGFSDAFVTVYDPAGTNYVYSTFLGGSGADQGNAIAVDATGAYVTGFTKSTNFPLLSASQGTFGGGLQDAFITKLNPTGTALLFSTYLGGSLDDAGTGIAIDSNHSVYVTGETGSANFPTNSPTQAASGGLNDAFVTQLSSTGARTFSTYLGGTANENTLQGTSPIGAIAVDSTGNIYVTGNTASTDFPTHSPFQVASGGSADAFVAKYAPDVTGSFTVAVSPGSATVTSGQTTSAITVTVAPVGVFSGDVTLSCSGLPAASTCHLTTNPVTGANGTSQLTISTTTHTSGAMLNARNASPDFLYTLVVVPGLALAGAGFVPAGSRRKKIVGLLMLCLMFSGFLFLPACGGGGGGGGGTPPGSYSVTVKGTSGATVVNGTPVIALTVQ